jgi:hypothetical protein
MADPLTKKRPIDAFTEYFSEVKPYHAKILEIVEKYNFYDSVVVNATENIVNNVILANTPLCRPVGFGLDWDDGCEGGCGFDALECCSLGTCATTPNTFLNLSPTISVPIQSITASTGDIYVLGNVTYDKTFQIKKIINQNSFSVAGDQTYYFNLEPIFTVIPFTTINYTTNATNSIVISGNYASQFTQRQRFQIYGSNYSDGNYNVISSIYSLALNSTTIIVAQMLIPNDAGTILVQSSTLNNGVFQVNNASFNGSDTIVNLNTTNRKLVSENINASVLFKTGFIPNRVVSLENYAGDNGNYLIVGKKFDPATNQTDISIANTLTYDLSLAQTLALSEGSSMIQSSMVQPSSAPNLVLQIKLALADYSADLLCNPPNENNVSVNFGENLKIIGGFVPSPTPTPSVTPTPSITPTLTTTPTVTTTATVTPTFTATVTPTLTRTVTPTISITGTPAVTQTTTPTQTPPVTHTSTPTQTPPVTHTSTPSPTPAASPTPAVSQTPFTALSYYVIDGDPRSAVYKKNFGKVGTIILATTAGGQGSEYRGAPFSVDPTTTNVVNCSYSTNGTAMPTSRPPQYEDNNAHTNMPVIFPTGGSGNYTVTVSAPNVTCIKQSYASSPSALGIVQATADAQTTISTYCGNAIMAYNTGSVYSAGPSKNLIKNGYYNGFGPIFGMVGCCPTADFQLGATFSVTIKDNVTGLTLVIPGVMAIDRSADGGQGPYGC